MIALGVSGRAVGRETAGVESCNGWRGGDRVT